MPFTGISDVMVRAPAVGLGIVSERRGRRVGPRWMLIAEDGGMVDDDESVGITE